MKKLFIFLALFLVSASVCSAQKYVLGDFLELDGVPCFVLQVDDSGQHGLIMSMPALGRGNMIIDFNEKVWVGQNAKKKDIANYHSQHPDWICKSFDWQSKKGSTAEEKKIYAQTLADLEEYLGSDGEKNTQIITSYCEEHGYDIARFFPEIAWAKNLGEGWYVAGDDELDKFATFYAGGVNQKILGARWLFIASDLSQGNFQMRYGLQAYAQIGIRSSSLCRNKKGLLMFQELVVMQTKAGPWWFIWNNGKWGGDRNVAAIRKF